ncbi:Uncharacterized HTH-type transcriptional regulator yxaF [Cedecea davisae]|uniref:Transcriptional regulator, TetR family n=1 Tax=Cedecea davisae DSM 4568 TaxID=566551 RepID=S3IXY0_9ENTR|nr:TetR/AcrR family transcriptional regulator [Cedecea davisae]EPF18553.1 transcriptional regulator, TetR family [Cedecea davisae DSM 4568]SUX28660.1 Uncharacterized HTH-type transcriptional regulator yxaF [Cedecea davisae]
MSTVTLSARDRILHTAHNLFYRDGIRATGIDRIIKEAGVTKVTFYRHFPAKNDLIGAFLDYRHRRWMAWFSETLKQEMARTGSLVQSLAAALENWFDDEAFRGCAFINSAVEMAEALPETLPIARAHKQAMVECLAGYLPHNEAGKQQAEMLALVIDGAIVKAQRDGGGEEALIQLRAWLALLPAAEN